MEYIGGMRMGLLPGEVDWLEVEGVGQRIIGLTGEILLEVGGLFSRHGDAFQSDSHSSALGR